MTRSITVDYATPVTEQLDQDEKPLLSAHDALLIPFSLMWGGFAIFWEAMAVKRGPLLMRLWGIPFVVVGLHLVFGRFFYDAWRRSRT